MTIRNKSKLPIISLFLLAFALRIVYCITHVQVRFRAPTEPIIAVIMSRVALARAVPQ